MADKKNRSLRTAVSFITAIAFLCCELIIILVFYGNMSGLLMTAEKRHMDEINDVIQSSLKASLINLHSNTRTWSSWDESYNYILGSNPDFVAGNLQDGTMLTMYKVDFVVIKDKDGKDLFKGASDKIIKASGLSEDQYSTLFPEGLSEHINPIAANVLENQESDRADFTEQGPYCDVGFTVSGGESYMLCVMPVVQSNESGDAAGTFTFFAKYGDQQMKALTNLSTTQFTFMEQDEDSPVFENSFEIVNDNDLAINTIIDNLYSNRSVLMHIDHPRLIYNDGIELINITIGALSLVIFIFFTLLFMLIDRLLLNSFRALVSDLDGVNNNTAIDIDKYHDFEEIHSLGTAINDMMIRVENSSIAEEKSKNSFNILKNILNGMDAYLYVSDPETDEILFINDTMKEHFDFTGDGVGDICWKVLQSGFEKKCEFCPCYKLKTLEDVEVWEEHNTVTNRYYSNTDRLIEWPDGRMVHLQHSVDITDIKMAEMELMAAKDLAEQGSRAKGEFLSRMSHEMRTPMNAIIGMTNIARSSDELEKKEYCLEKIDNASRHLLGVINDILDMSKIEADKFELSCAEFDINAMLLNVINVIGFKAEEKEQALSLNVDKKVPRMLWGDEQRLSQVLTNLLTNAVKFTPEKGCVDVNVKVNKADNENTELLFEIIDTGIGITEEQQQRLFTSFEQADGSITRRFGGTGLGLAISKRIVELMDGNVWVESEKDKGSKFAFTIVVKPLNTGEIADTDEEAPATEAVTSFPGKTILLAEDVELNREIVVAILEDTGIDIESAENGAEAVRMFSERPEKYDLIFMDMHMPEMDGLEATRRIRAMKNEYSRMIPIVAMTANVFKEDIDQCLEAGMNDHIGKPIDISELITKLSKYLKTKGTTT